MSTYRVFWHVSESIEGREILTRSSQDCLAEDDDMAAEIVRKLVWSQIFRHLTLGSIHVYRTQLLTADQSRIAA